MAIRLSVLRVLPPPYPVVQDEYSYLLGADTFASGRLTNPPHPMWVHFETIHENFQPTYSTKYPPAQSLFMALGQRFLGHPWFGVWISFGLMCACICWMLQGWMPPVYSLFGALVGAAQIGFFHYWMDSYWGGAVAAAGGCLVLGALPRLVKRPSNSAAILGALGLVVLANTRPYEGLVFSLSVGVALLWWRRRSRRKLRELLTPGVIVPFAAILVVAACWMAYYNYRLTGNALLMPYVLHQRTYSPDRIFSFLPSGPPPVYRHEVLRKLYTAWNHDFYLRARAKPWYLLASYLGSALLLIRGAPAFLMLAVICLARGPKVRVPLALGAVMTVALLMAPLVQPHYAAPITGAPIILAMYGARWLRVRFVRFGPAVVTLFTACVLAGGLYDFRSEREQAEKPQPRQQIENTIMKQAGPHLVLLRYTPSHDPGDEFVYNAADIDRSPIVWARDMGDEGNRELLDYYPTRKVWLLQPDLTPISLTPYAPGSQLPR